MGSASVYSLGLGEQREPAVFVSGHYFVAMHTKPWVYCNDNSEHQEERANSKYEHLDTFDPVSIVCKTELWGQKQ